MPELRVPFGIEPDGTEVRAEAAFKGRQYNCPDCRGELILKQGTIRTPHFAHKVDPEVCDFLSETEDHWRAKHLVVQLIRERKSIRFMRPCPKCLVPKAFGVPESIVDATTEFTLVTGHRSDVALFDDQKTCRAVIEVLVTHQVDKDKAHALNERGIPWVEIEASVILMAPDLSWALTQDHFRPFTCGGCRRAEAEAARIQDEERQQKAQAAESRRQREALKERFTAVRPFVGPKRDRVGCPLPGRSNVSPIDDCLDCDYWLNANPEGIVCFGGPHAANR